MIAQLQSIVWLLITTVMLIWLIQSVIFSFFISFFSVKKKKKELEILDEPIWEDISTK